ncbi:MAG: hypothetical protein ACRDTJ_25555 [Pseudonocardiaceae bacterium]
MRIFTGGLAVDEPALGDFTSCCNRRDNTVATRRGTDQRGWVPSSIRRTHGGVGAQMHPLPGGGADHRTDQPSVAHQLVTARREVDSSSMA